MYEPPKKKATGDDLFNIPENMIGEIIEGELVINPEPSWKQHLAAILLDDLLLPAQSADGLGTAGWAFLLRPKIELGDSVLVPYLAGWKKERFPSESDRDRVAVIPDWACEILSDDITVLDKTRRMPIYARYGLPHLWLVDPKYKRLGLICIYELDPESHRWLWLGGDFNDDKVRSAPFHEMELDLSVLMRRLAVIPTRRQTIPKSVHTV